MELQRRADVLHFFVHFRLRYGFFPRIILRRARAFHCAELAYCFDNVDRCLNATGGTPAARKLSGQMADAWLAFAKTGDPNHRGLPKWPAVGGGRVPHMLFDAACKVTDARG